jgi:flagellar protein FlaI
LNERVVSIEDTIELSLLGRENWVALEGRSSVGSEVTMDALLKNSMRMRPDRIVVGEVRGSEALTLFTAMDTGHQGCLGTIHANNARETIIKLQERPLSVPQAMLPLLDFVVVMERHYSPETGMVRRVTQIVELSRMEQKVLFGTLFEYDNKSDSLKRTEISSSIFEEVAQKNSMTKNELKKELEVRKVVLEWMIKQGIRKPLEVLEVIESYYYNPEKVLSTISELQ